jgi:hypothetical protein
MSAELLANPLTGQLLLKYSFCSFEFEQVWRSWLEALNERGHNVPVTSRQFVKMIEGQSQLVLYRLRTRHIVSVGEGYRLEWEYDDDEPALELCSEFIDLLVHHANFDWSQRFRQKRIPRRFRKARVRNRRRLLKELQLASLSVPGAFPVELADDGICDTHGQHGRCCFCYRQRYWEQRAQQALGKADQTTLTV